MSADESTRQPAGSGYAAEEGGAARMTVVHKMMATGVAVAEAEHRPVAEPGRDTREISN